MTFGGTPVTRAQFEANMAAKITDAPFVTDVSPLLRTGIEHDLAETTVRDGPRGYGTIIDRADDGKGRLPTVVIVGRPAEQLISKAGGELDARASGLAERGKSFGIERCVRRVADLCGNQIVQRTTCWLGRVGVQVHEGLTRSRPPQEKECRPSDHR